MAWLESMRPASFRGVPFKIDTVGLTVGRRLARHEYPQRDIPYLEDMGRKAREYKIEALIVGQNYTAGRDRLLKALEQAGPGQLVHPYYGSMQVVVAGECQVVESTQHGGLVKIAIAFIEAGKQQDPKASADTQAILKDQYASCNASFAGDFSGKFKVAGAQDFVQQDGLNSVQRLMGMPGMGISNPAAVRANPASPLNALLPENLQSSLLAPAKLATGILSMISTVASPLALLGFNLPTVPSSVMTASRLLQNSNRTAMTDLVQQGATARQVMDLSGSTPVTLDDARVSRTQVVNLTDNILMRDSTGQSSADSLLQLRTDAISHFATLVPSLPTIRQVTPQAVLPSIVMAHDQYGDDWLGAGRDAELVARNRITHPGFVPAGQEIAVVS